jgi:hypothetical protein
MSMGGVAGFYNPEQEAPILWRRTSFLLLGRRWRLDAGI